jgi:hypothetical protein
VLTTFPIASLNSGDAISPDILTQDGLRCPRSRVVSAHRPIDHSNDPNRSTAVSCREPERVRAEAERKNSIQSADDVRRVPAGRASPHPAHSVGIVHDSSREPFAHKKGLRFLSKAEPFRTTIFTLRLVTFPLCVHNVSIAVLDCHSTALPTHGKMERTLVLELFPSPFIFNGFYRSSFRTARFSWRGAMTPLENDDWEVLPVIEGTKRFKTLLYKRRRNGKGPAGRVNRGVGEIQLLLHHAIRLQPRVHAHFQNGRGPVWRSCNKAPRSLDR